MRKYKYVYEMCPHCMNEVKLAAKIIYQICPKCKHLIKPCAMCVPDETNCNKCPLGRDVDIIIGGYWRGNEI